MLRIASDNRNKPFIIHPNSSYSLLYLGIAIFFTLTLATTIIKIYADNTMKMYLDIGILCFILIPLIVYCFTNSYRRKLTITNDLIENKRGFPLRTQKISKKDIKAHRLITSESFAGGRSGEDLRIEFIGKNNRIISTWNVNGFEKSELERYL